MKTKQAHRYAPRNTRVKPRLKNHKKPNIKLLFGLFAISAAVSSAASFTLQTPLLAVREVKISGAKLADRAKVERAAKPVLGCNIFLIKKSPIVQGIACLSEVGRVTVGRDFPNKIWVKVDERKAAGVLTDGNIYCLAQDDGFIFHKVNGPIKGLPLLEVANCDPIKVGKKCSAQSVSYALNVLKLAREERLAVDKISVDPLSDICLNMEGGFYVKLGQPDDIAKKLSYLRSTLVYKPSIVKEAVYIDLSCLSAPVWKRKSVEVAAS